MGVRSSCAARPLSGTVRSVPGVHATRTHRSGCPMGACTPSRCKRSTDVCDARFAPGSSRRRRPAPGTGSSPQGRSCLRAGSVCCSSAPAPVRSTRLRCAPADPGTPPHRRPRRAGDTAFAIGGGHTDTLTPISNTCSSRLGSVVVVGDRVKLVSSGVSVFEVLAIEGETATVESVDKDAPGCYPFLARVAELVAHED